jgi:hypothetical protein
MARSLLAPTAFLTLLGLCPACLDEDRASAAPTTPAALVAVATARSGNARTPSYDDRLMNQKGGGGPSGVTVVASAAPAPDAR